MKKLIFLMWGVLVYHDAYAEWVDWSLDGNTSATLEDNINHASISAEKHNDQIFSTNISGGRAYQLSD